MKIFRAVGLAGGLFVAACGGSSTDPDGSGGAGGGAGGASDETACPPPAQWPSNTACPGQYVFAKDPDVGTCCGYGTSCEAPDGWALFGDEAACDAAP